MVLFYLLLWAVGPHLLTIEHVPVAPRPQSTAREDGDWVLPLAASLARVL